jgi:hypothetical protein
VASRPSPALDLGATPLAHGSAANSWHQVPVVQQRTTLVSIERRYSPGRASAPQSGRLAVQAGRCWAPGPGGGRPLRVDARRLPFSSGGLPRAAYLPTIRAACRVLPGHKGPFDECANTHRLAQRWGTSFTSPYPRGGRDLSRLHASLALLIVMMLCILVFPQRLARAGHGA